MAESSHSTGLSERLAGLRTWVQSGSSVLDVGTDHALLPIHLITQGRARFVVAGDVAQGPYETALRNVKRASLEGQIDVRLGSGLTVIRPGEVDTIIIAGMGGATIADILTAAPEPLDDVRALLLQPMNATMRLRETLRQLQFCIVDEQMLAEAGHFYQLIYAKPGSINQVRTQYEPYILRGQEWLALEFGPVNLERRDHVALGQAIHEARNHIHRILAGLAANSTSEAAVRRQQLTERVAQLEAWLAGDATEGKTT